MKTTKHTGLFMRKLLCLLVLMSGMTWVQAQTYVTGNVSGTWTKANSPYILDGNVTVPTGLKLTIQAGVEVRSLKYDDYFDVEGSLYAVGIPTDSIRFNGFANSAYSASSTHGGVIYLNSPDAPDSTVLSYVAINKMGDKDYYTTAAVELGNGNIKILNTNIRNSEITAITDYTVATPNFVVSNVTFLNNPIPASMYATNVSGFSNNTNAVVTLKATSYGNSVTIPKPGGAGSYYLMDKGAYYYFSDGVVTIQPGVEIRSTTYDNILQVNGNAILIARGTATDSIRITGVSNTGYAGSSNYGGYISLASTNTTDSSVIAYALIDRMGDKDFSNTEGAIVMTTGLVTIRNSIIKNSESKGISDDGYYTQGPIISNVTFLSNPIPASMYATNVAGFSNNTNAVITLKQTSYGNSVTIPKPGGTGSYYLMDKGAYYYFSDGVVTIQPGVEIKSTSYDNVFQVNGNAVLIAKGTATDSIKITGVSNTSYAGSSNYGGYISLASTNTTDSSVIAYALIDRMGDKDYNNTEGAIVMNTGLVTIRNSTIKNSESKGISDDGYYTTIAPIVSNVTFINNPIPASMYATNVSGFSNNTNAVITLKQTSYGNSVTLPKPGGTGSYYLMDKGAYYYFSDGVVTIQPGVEIRSTTYDNIFQVNGNAVLIAKGTATDSIRITGVSNTAYAGSSNYGGYISLASTNTTDSSVIAYAVIDRMGDKDYGNTEGAILITTGLVTIRNSTIKNSESKGISDDTYYTEGPIVSNVTFLNNPIPAYMYATNVAGFSNNTNAVITLKGTNYGNSVTIPKPGGSGSYYLMDKGASYYFSDGVVTIQPGVEIRSTTYDNIFQVYSNAVLVAKGTVTDSIRITGVSNTTYQASSNYGGKIYLGSSNTTDSSIIAYAVIDRMGDKDYSATGAIEINSGLVAIRNSSIRNSELNALYGSGDASGMLVSRTDIFNNKTGGNFFSGKPKFTQCNIFSNPTYGINNQSSTSTDVIDARTCWWGSASGPKQTTTNPSGTGNPVSLQVLYSPYLTSPYSGTATVVNIGIDSITTPVSNCNLTSSETIRIKIRNAGTAAQTGFNVSYRINNGTAVTENVGTLSVAAGSTQYYNFTAKANLSTGAGTTYNIQAYTSLSGDTTKSNDTAKVVIKNNKPNLGKDTTYKVCQGTAANIGTLYTTTGYTSVVWSTTRPDSVTTAGNYTLIVTNSFGCKDTAVVTLVYNAKPSLGKDTTYKICQGTAANITALYTTTGYTSVVWSTTRPDSVTAAGNYTLIVTNSFGCKDTAVVILAYNAKPNLGKDTTYKVCHGLAANISTLYTTTGYTSVVWSTTRPDSVTAAGNYTLIVTNSFGCKDTAVVTLAYNAKPNLGKDTTVNVCAGIATNITTLYNTTGYSSVVWNTTRPDSVTAAGNYRLIVTNSFGCKDTAVVTVTIASGSAITSTVTTTNAGCFGGKVGSIKVMPTNGTAPYQYKNGAAGTYQPLNLFKGLSAGSYTVYIKDARSCTGNTPPVVITQFQPLLLSFVKTNETCTGKADGTIKVTATGGKPPYQYRLGTSGIYQDSANFVNLKPGTYTVYVKDLAGCTGATSLITINASTTSCFQHSSIALNGINAGNPVFNLSLSPNPSTNAFTLLVHADNAKPVQVKVLDVNGKSLYETKGQPEQAYRFGSSFAPGTYLVEVRQGDEVKTLKVVKM